MVRSNFSAVSRKEGTQGTVALLKKKKKRPRLCTSKLRSNEFCSAESWRIGIERFGGTHLKFSGCNWYKIEFGKGKGQPGGSIQKGEPRGQNPCAPGFEEWTLEEIARQADCDSKVAWNLERKKHNAAQERFWAQIKKRHFEKVQRPLVGTDRDWEKVQITEDARVLFVISICS